MTAAERLDVATADSLLRHALDSARTRLARGWVSSWLGRGDRAAEEFAELGELGARATVAQAVNLATTLGRPAAATDL